MNILRYPKLYFAFFKNCLLRELEFRFNLLIWSLQNLLWLPLAFFGVGLIFGRATTIGGWSKEQVLLLICVQALFFDFSWTFIFTNIGAFLYAVRYGDFDFILLKPVSPRFWLSARFFDFDHFLRMPILVFLIFRLLENLKITPGPFDWFAFIFLFFCGFFAFQSLFFAITSTVFWFINIFNLLDLFVEIVDIGRVPTSVFPKGLQTFFIYVLPIAFIAYFPTKALMGNLEVKWLWITPLITAVIFVASQLFFHFALKHYSSASS